MCTLRKICHLGCVKMRIRNVDFPGLLLEARKNGQLVVFAGAGVSIPAPSNYPNFNGLADRVAGGSLTRESGERVDHFLGRLKDHGVAVHQIVHRILSDETSKPNHLHKGLLGLFSSPTNVRVVTTNFDLHFNASVPIIFSAEQDPETYTAPALPLGATFCGIVYLHGSVAKPADRMILTDSDFGSAYLTDGWATRFLQQLFLHNVVLFVGYSHDDIVVDYLARGLTPESKSPRRYALTIAGNEAHWKRLGIIPIMYPHGDEENKHAALGPAIEGWVQLVRATALDHEERIKSIVQQPLTLDPDEQDYIEEACKDPSRLQFFTRYADRADWLRWIEGKGLLENLFLQSSAPAESDRYLAFWFARNFACDYPNDALALVQRHGGQIGLNLWQQICLAFHSKNPSDEVVAKWVPTLLLAAPHRTNADLLEYMLCARRLPHEEATIFLLLEHLTEIRTDLKKRRWPTESEDVEIELSARGSEFWLNQAWQLILKPSLDSIADRLLLMFTSNILRAYAALRSFQADSSSWDQLSGSRAQIESSAYGGPPDALDLIIDMACEALKSTIANHPQRADFFIDYWLTSGCRLLRRMSIYGVSDNPHWTPDAKMKWLLQNSLIHSYGYKAEVFLVLKKSFAFASEVLREQVLEAAKAGPDISEQQTKDYEVYNILQWLKDSAPTCNRTDLTYKSFKENHPEFGPREHPELDWWVGPAQMGGPSSPLSDEEALKLEPDELYQRLSEAKPGDMIGPSREGLLYKVQRAVTQDYDWSARLAKRLAELQVWEADIWKAVAGGWLGADLGAEQWAETLKFLLDYPQITDSTLYEASSLLQNGIQKDKHPIPTSCFYASSKLVERLWGICETSYKEGAGEPEDWLGFAINHPAGNLLLFTLRTISELRKEAKEEWSGIPQNYKRFLATVVNGESYSAGVGRVIIASQVFFLFTSDPEWAVENVLPLFSFGGNPKRAVQSWHGFLTWGGWNLDLLPHLLKYFIEAFEHLHSGFNKEQRQAFCRHLAGIACQSLTNPIDEGWLHGFLITVSVDEHRVTSRTLSRRVLHFSHLLREWECHHCIQLTPRPS
jgi:hypothetical protein